MAPTETMTRLRLRPYAGESDLAEILRIQNAEAEADRIDERESAAGIAAEYGHPSESFDARRDVTIAEIDGRAVAFGQREWVDTTDGFREYRINGCVDPAWRRQGLGAAMLAENERLVRELAATHETSRTPLLGSWSMDSQPGDIALLQGAGYAPARWFFDMARPTLDDVPGPAAARRPRPAPGHAGARPAGLARRRGRVSRSLGRLRPVRRAPRRAGSQGRRPISGCG